MFVKALGDDVSRPAAEKALRGVAEKVKPLLFQAARRIDARDDERPSDRQRRRSVVRILTHMVLTEEDWKELKPLLQDGDQEIEIMAGEMAVDWAPPTERQQAARFFDPFSRFRALVSADTHPGMFAARLCRAARVDRARGKSTATSRARRASGGPRGADTRKAAIHRGESRGERERVA